MNRSVEQRSARVAHNHEVAGSNPAGATSSRLGARPRAASAEDVGSRPESPGVRVIGPSAFGLRVLVLGYAVLILVLGVRGHP